MQVYNYMTTPEYKGFIKQHIEDLKTLKNFDIYYTDLNKVAEEKQKMEKDLNEKIKTYYENEIQKLDTQLKNIELQCINSTEKYSDPQAEILARQDFDLELANMDIYEATRILEDNRRILSKYEVSKIELNFKDTDYTRFKTALFIRKRELSESYELNSDYQEKKALRNILNVLKNRAVELFYIKDGSEKGYSAYNLSVLGRDFREISIDYEIDKFTKLL